MQSGEIQSLMETLHTRIHNTTRIHQNTQYIHARIVKKEIQNITFLALYSLELDDWAYGLIRQIQEEQVDNLGALWQEKSLCRLGCQVPETAYQVVSSSVVQAYTARHDTIVYWILQFLMNGMEAPIEVTP